MSSKARRVPCKVCNIVSSSIVDYRNHVMGKNHKQRLIESQFESSPPKVRLQRDVAARMFNAALNDCSKNKASTDKNFTCAVCDVITSCPISLETHFSDPFHLKMLTLAPSQKQTCDICCVGMINFDGFNAHVKSTEHQNAYEKVVASLGLTDKMQKN